MLFGHQNEDSNQPSGSASISPSSVNPLAVDPATGASLPVAPVPPSPLDSVEPSVLNQPVSDDATATAPVIEPTAPFAAEPMVSTPEPEPTPPVPAPVAASMSDAPVPETPVAPAAPTSDALLSLKQQALEQLSPLVGQLDLTPEERFRTTMMMIQSTDNQALLQDAYTAAQAIEDEKVRAQALLDVINEINYFTQPKPAAAQ